MNYPLLIQEAEIETLSRIYMYNLRARNLIIERIILSLQISGSRRPQIQKIPFTNTLDVSNCNIRQQISPNVILSLLREENCKDL